VLDNVTARSAVAKQRRAVPPVDAASLVLIERRRGRLRVLMGRRHDRHAFMPGFMVFPGGRLDPSDRAMCAFGTLAPPSERRLLASAPRLTSSKARALALCAIRETAEETGVLLGESGLGDLPKTPPAWTAFAEHGVFPSLEALHFVARAVTPPAMPRRFDTRFFAAEAEAIALRLEDVAGPDAELVSLAWLTFDEAERENLAGVTRLILREVKQRLRLGLSRDLPVPHFLERHGQWLRREIA
jgi:8-oxo-dGTP pyrophosphatase MutT (NUDIX family)